MFTKLLRSKNKKQSLSETSRKSVGGMPELKEKRKRERSEELMMKIRQSGNFRLTLNDFERTGISSSKDQMKFIGRVQVPNNHDKTSSSSSSAEIKIDKRSISETSSRKGSLQYQSKTDECGKDLPHIKKQRKASRESDPSVIALTPRERESILLLDNVLKEHDMFESLDDDDDTSDDDVFRDQETGMKIERITKLLDEDSDEDSISMSSVIDLVGNLSTPRSSDVIEPIYSTRIITSPPSDISPVYETIFNMNPDASIATSEKPAADCKVDQAEPIYTKVKKKKEDRKPKITEFQEDISPKTGFHEDMSPKTGFHKDTGLKITRLLDKEDLIEPIYTVINKNNSNRNQSSNQQSEALSRLDESSPTPEDFSIKSRIALFQNHSSSKPKSVDRNNIKKPAVLPKPKRKQNTSSVSSPRQFTVSSAYKHQLSLD